MIPTDTVDVRPPAADVLTHEVSEVLKVYFGNPNTKATPDEVATLIERAYGAVRPAAVLEDHPDVARVAEVAPLKPAVPIEDSIQEDGIICLEDGQKMHMLKRYLKARYNMTPDEYRRKWGLPATYPMTSPAYAATRSELAKQQGLGRRPAPEPVPKRGRAKATAPDPLAIGEPVKPRASRKRA